MRLAHKLLLVHDASVLDDNGMMKVRLGEHGRLRWMHDEMDSPAGPELDLDIRVGKAIARHFGIDCGIVDGRRRRPRRRGHPFVTK